MINSENKLWFFEQFSLFTWLDKEQMINMENSLEIKQFFKNDIISFESTKTDYVYFLKNGFVKIINTNENGDEFIKTIINPGEIFGELVLLENTENENDFAVAIEDCMLCFMSGESLKDMMKMNTKLNSHIHKIIGLRIKKIENRLLSMVFKDAETRIYDFLKEFAIQYGTSNNNIYSVKLFLTHSDISKLTATTRQTVTIVMNKLRENKKIQYERRRLLIPINKF